MNAMNSQNLDRWIIHRRRRIAVLRRWAANRTATSAEMGELARLVAALGAIGQDAGRA